MVSMFVKYCGAKYPTDDHLLLLCIQVGILMYAPLAPSYPVVLRRQTKTKNVGWPRLTPEIMELRSAADNKHTVQLRNGHEDCTQAMQCGDAVMPYYDVSFVRGNCTRESSTLYPHPVGDAYA